MTEITPSALLADLREHAFGLIGAGSARPRRIGAEVEMIAVLSDTGAVVPLEATEPGPSLIGFLRCYGATRGWAEEAVTGAAPQFRLPDGGTIGFEPGGQVEYSTPPCATAAELLECLRAVVTPLRSAAAEQGLDLLGAGIDPFHPIDESPLQVRTPRYLRMTDYLQRIGPSGVIMMRQSASIQVSLDFEDEPLPRWRMLNAAAPCLIAIFANSALYAGHSTGHRSFRAHVWRTLDRDRTGIFRADADPVGEYLDFALAAPSVLQGPTPDEGGDYLPFRTWMHRGEVGHEEWRHHLSTLFPEVCPRGYLEVRSIDALAPKWYAAPIALLAGLTYHRPSLDAAADLLGAPDPDFLARAGRDGLTDPRTATIARDLFEIALRGCWTLGPDFLHPSDLAIAHEFYDCYTRRGRSPAEDVVPPAGNGTPVPERPQATASMPQC